MPDAVVDEGSWRKGHADYEAHHEAAVNAVIDVDASGRLLTKCSGILPPRDDLDGQVEGAAGEEGAWFSEDSQTSFFFGGVGKACGNRKPDCCGDSWKGVIRVAAANVEDGRFQAQLLGVGKDFSRLLDATYVCSSFGGYARG